MTSKIEIKKVGKSKSDIYVDGNLLAFENRLFGESDDFPTWITLYDEFFKELNNYTLDIFSQFQRVKFPQYPKHDWVLGGETEILNKFWSDIPCIRIKVQPNLDNWSLPFSAAKFVDTFEFYCKKETLTFFMEDEEILFNGFGISIPIIDWNKNASEAMNSSLLILDRVIDKTYNSLTEELNPESVISFFNFPEEIKVQCEQYLIYFIQFLKDLGINAHSEFEEHSNGTLFKVTPSDKKQVLDEIRLALSTYLEIPTLSNLEVLYLENNDTSVQQLVANVMHFKGQLLLSQATIQMKDSTIENLTLSNYRYKELLETREERNTSQKKNKEKKNEVTLFNGLLTIKEFEKYGLKINLPKIIRMMKRK